MVPPAPITNYLDTLALAIAAGAAWWRELLRERNARGCFTPALTEEQLEAFERHLCLGMAKLLLQNAQQGISWRYWVIKTSKHPDEVLRTAAASATIGLHVFPFNTNMRLKSTADQVHVHVRHLDRESQQVWPKAA